MNWRRFLHREQADAEQQQELESYLEITAEEYIAQGMQPEEARSAARRKLGNPARIREEVYEMNTNALAETVVRSGLHWLRSMRKSPGFAAVSILTLALGIGAAMAVFTVVNAVLLKPLPYPEAERLISVQQVAPGAAGIVDASGELRLSASLFFTYFDHNRTLENIGAWIAGTATLTGQGDPEQMRILGVTQGVFEALKVPPAAGRWLSGGDQEPGAAPAVVLNYGFWQRKFGGARELIGRTIQMDGVPRLVVGVMPGGFRVADTEADAYIPFQFQRSQLILPGFAFHGLARLKRGESIASASSDLLRLIPVWMDSWPAPPGVNPHNWERWRITPALRPLKQDVVGGVEAGLWVVMATIGIVLLIACANVLNLLLVRAEARRRELAVRAALGAGKGRIVVEMLGESSMLALVSGGLGLAIASGVVKLVVAFGPASLPRLSEIAIDGRTAAFTLLISLAAACVLGLVPALKEGGTQVAGVLRGEGRGSSLSLHSGKTLGSLVIGQVALALVLLIAAGLMIRTFVALSRVEQGFRDAQHIETFRLNIPVAQVPETERVIRQYEQLSVSLASVPGVTAVGFASTLPADGQPANWDGIAAVDKPVPPGQFPPLRRFKSVSPGFFEAMGTHLKAGRTYEWRDLRSHRPVVILSENLARELWGSAANAIGKRIAGQPDPFEVVGVVEDVRDNGVWELPPPTVYWMPIGDSFGSYVTRNLTFTVKTNRTGQASLVTDLEHAVWRVNSSLSLAALQSMEEIQATSTATTSFTMAMLTITGGMALVLGLIGLYGVISYSVVRRRREVGIRIALGAEPGAVQRMFVGRALGLTLAGVAIGLAGAAAVTQSMTRLLYGVKPLDAPTYIAMAAALLVAALCASFIPARRATKVDPLEALRSE